MVLIPIGMSYHVTLTGRAPKLVRCEACEYEYVYLLESTAAGHGSSPLFLDNQGAQNEARATAHALLDAALWQGCAVVPCARCGHVQGHMIPKARHEYRRWMFTTGIYSLVIGGILILPAVIVTLLADEPAASDTVRMFRVVLWSIVAVLVGCGLVLPYVRFLRGQRYEPNRLPLDLRRRWGDDLSVSKDEYLKIAQT